MTINDLTELCVTPCILTEIKNTYNDEKYTNSVYFECCK